MRGQPTLGIVTVSYRSSRQLGALLGSTEALPDCTVVVVDNGREAEVRDLVDRAPGEARSVRYVDPGVNLGYAAAVNLGVRRCGDVDLVLVCNPDVVLTRDPRELAPYLRDDVLVVAGVLEHGGRPWDPTRPPANAHPAPTVGLELRRSVLSWSRAYRWRRPVTAPQPVGQADGAWLLMRRSTFEALGGLDERYELYYEDVDLADRVRRQGTLLFVPELVGRHAGAQSARRSEGMAYRLLSVSRVRYYALRPLGPLPRTLAAATSVVEFAVRTVARRPEGDRIRRRTLRDQIHEIRHPGTVWLLGAPRAMTPPRPWTTGRVA